jgi:hypothetical protein
MTRRPRLLAQLRNRGAAAGAEASEENAIIARRLQSLERRGPARAAFAVDYTPRLTNAGMLFATGRA